MRGRGVGWVLAQSLLLVLVAALCVFARSAPSPAVRVAGAALAVAGVAIAVWAVVALGPSLTPFPRPKPEGELVTTGPFAFVRHPLYTGALLLVAGASLAYSWWALIATGALAVLWALKASVEERHLARAFPAYDGYRRDVRARFVPRVY